MSMDLFSISLCYGKRSSSTKMRIKYEKNVIDLFMEFCYAAVVVVVVAICIVMRGKFD
jgi:hypothetical protein